MRDALRCGPKGLASRHNWVAMEQYGNTKEEWLKQFLELPGLIESVIKIDGETTTNKRYYLNSFSSDAQLLARAVRSHWGSYE